MAEHTTSTTPAAAVGAHSKQDAKPTATTPTAKQDVKPTVTASPHGTQHSEQDAKTTPPAPPHATRTDSSPAAVADAPDPPRRAARRNDQPQRRLLVHDTEGLTPRSVILPADAPNLPVAIRLRDDTLYVWHSRPGQYRQVEVVEAETDNATG